MQSLISVTTKPERFTTRSGSSDESDTDLPRLKKISDVRKECTAGLTLPSFTELISAIGNTKVARHIVKGKPPLHGATYMNQIRSASLIPSNFFVPRNGILSSISSTSSNLSALASISTAKNYSTSILTKEKEENAFKYLIHFFSTSESLIDCLKEMSKHLNSIKLTKDEALPVEPGNLISGLDSFSNENFVTRENFREWIIDIPDIMYENISDAVSKFAAILGELKIMKLNYKDEEKLKKIELQLEKERKLQNDQETLEVLRTYNDSSSSDLISNATISKSSSSTTTTKSTPKLKPTKVSKPRIKKVKKNNVICKHCNAAETPEWRKGPDGSRTLCNACGLFYSKLVKKFGSDEGTLILKFRKDNNHVNDRTVPSEKDHSKIMAHLVANENERSEKGYNEHT